MSAQVTEAHRGLARRIMFEFTQAGTATASDVRDAAQLIADSEAKEVALHRHIATQLAALLNAAGAPEFANAEHASQWAKEISGLRAERDQLRAEAQQAHITRDATCIKLAGELREARAEVEKANGYINLQVARAEHAEAEVERLGHLEAVLRSSAADMTAGSITAGGVADLRAENERLRRAYVRPDDIRAQLESANARAERAEASLHALRLVCGTTDADKFSTWVDRANARAARAEAELGKLQELHGCSHGMVVHWCAHAAERSQGLDQARADLAVERARLDHIINSYPEGHPFRISRAAIDAAMKEGAK